jgi:hypothetical protein
MGMGADALMERQGHIQALHLIIAVEAQPFRQAPYIVAAQLLLDGRFLKYAE